jgi:hypothetical protein
VDCTHVVQKARGPPGRVENCCAGIRAQQVQRTGIFQRIHLLEQQLARREHTFTGFGDALTKVILRPERRRVEIMVRSLFKGPFKFRMESSVSALFSEYPGRTNGGTHQ